MTIMTLDNCVGCTNERSAVTSVLLLADVELEQYMLMLMIIKPSAYRVYDAASWSLNDSESVGSMYGIHNVVHRSLVHD